MMKEFDFFVSKPNSDERQEIKDAMVELERDIQVLEREIKQKQNEKRKVRTGRD